MSLVAVLSLYFRLDFELVLHFVSESQQLQPVRSMRYVADRRMDDVIGRSQRNVRPMVWGALVNKSQIRVVRRLRALVHAS